MTHMLAREEDPIKQRWIGENNKEIQELEGHGNYELLISVILNLVILPPSRCLRNSVLGCHNHCSKHEEC